MSVPPSTGQWPGLPVSLPDDHPLYWPVPIMPEWPQSYLFLFLCLRSHICIWAVLSAILIETPLRDSDDFIMTSSPLIHDKCIFHADCSESTNSDSSQNTSLQYHGTTRTDSGLRRDALLLVSIISLTTDVVERNSSSALVTSHSGSHCSLMRWNNFQLPLKIDYLGLSPW